LSLQFKHAFENRLLVGLVSLCLLGLFAWQIGLIVAQQFHVASVPTLPVVQSNNSVVEAQGKPSYLFGKYQAPKAQKPVKAVVDPNEVIKSQLNLKLVGLIDMGDSGVALIEKSGKTLAVLEGEEIQPRVKLIDVLADQVIILHNGVKERLLLKSSADDLFSVGQKQQSTASNKPRIHHRSNETDNGYLDGSQASQLNEIGKELKSKPMAIAKYIRFQPLNKAGSWTGVQIWAKNDRALFNAVGFEEGDILKEVNGKSINDMAKKPALWQKFLSGNSFDLVVERDGQPVPISVQFDE